MDPSEIIKAAPEIAKGAGAIAAAIPFTSIVKRMLGPAADEVAEMWRDQVRVYRYERQVKLLEKVEKIAKDAGFEPQSVPPKILFPLLEGASVEDNESLHDMWAALLANAASPNNAPKVHPAFIATLKQMAPDDARTLKEILHRSGSDLLNPDVVSVYHFRSGAASAQHCEADRLAVLSLYNLQSQALIYWIDERPEADVSLTARGVAFLEACLPPKPKS
ncbi:MAG TPA: Abi-alpha family protein [Bryobacteraceae bacterium]|jgi:hypothetical protein